MIAGTGPEGRPQWGLDLLISGDQDRVYLALLVLQQQSAVRVVDADDTAFIVEVVRPIADFYLRGLDAGDEEGADVDGAGDGPAEEQL